MTIRSSGHGLPHPSHTRDSSPFLGAEYGIGSDLGRDMAPRACNQGDKLSNEGPTLYLIGTS